MTRLEFLLRTLEHHEKEIMEFCVFESKMPRGHFIKSFAENSTNLKWLKSELKADKPYVKRMKELRHSIIDQQNKLNRY